MAGNRAIFTSSMTEGECFDKLLELTKKTQGNWLIMHREVIKDYLCAYADEEGWGDTTYRLKNRNSILSLQITTLIECARRKAYDKYDKNILELSKAQCMKCTIKAEAYLYMEDYAKY